MRVRAVLSRAYPESLDIKRIADEAKIARSSIAFQERSGDAIWHDLLFEAARSTLTRALFTRVLADNSVAAFHAELNQLCAEGGLSDPDAIGELCQTGRTPGGRLVELSLDVVRAHASSFAGIGVATPAQWTEDELSRLKAKNGGPSKFADLVDALHTAIQAKAVAIGLDVGRLELARLQGIYKKQIGRWPRGASIDALLVEAADADINACRQDSGSELGPLARFMIGVAAELSVPPESNDSLAEWIQMRGHSPADGQRRYDALRSAPAWLLIDFGPEPRPTDDPVGRRSIHWPTHVRWTYSSQEDVLAQDVSTGGTKGGLADALKTIFDALPSFGSLTVDLAMPADLLRVGVERWPLFTDEFGDPESIRDRYQPRLRWSQRRHNLASHHRCVERTESSTWEIVPDPLPDDVLRDRSRLIAWARDVFGPALVIGRHPSACPADPLKHLLKDGFAFVIWFPLATIDTSDDPRYRQIVTALTAIPPASRRSASPDELAKLKPDDRLVIWDDPRGRGEFALPIPVVAGLAPVRR